MVSTITFHLLVFDIARLPAYQIEVQEQHDQNDVKLLYHIGNGVSIPNMKNEKAIHSTEAEY